MLGTKSEISPVRLLECPHEYHLHGIIGRKTLLGAVWDIYADRDFLVITLVPSGKIEQLDRERVAVELTGRS